MALSTASGLAHTLVIIVRFLLMQIVCIPMR
jgi:hypothetical protein